MTCAQVLSIRITCLHGRRRSRCIPAVSRYVDWEALAYWAGPALDRGSRLPAEVERRCPGFLDAYMNAREQDSSGASEDWPRLMLWIVDHFFRDAKAEGWLDAILIQVRSYPRAIRGRPFLPV